jgi:hypothetical protein
VQYVQTIQREANAWLDQRQYLSMDPPAFNNVYYHIFLSEQIIDPVKEIHQTFANS